MQIEISGHQMDVTQPLRDYVHTKFERIVRHFEHAMSTHVVLGLDRLDHKAEATINAPGKTFFADATESDMYAAIDVLTDKLDKQVRRYKDKITDHHRGATKMRDSV